MWKNSRSFGASARAYPRLFPHNSSIDVLSEPDDSYPILEPKKTRGAKNTIDPSRGGIGTFFTKPPAPAVHSEGDVVMSEGGATTVNIGSADEQILGN